MKALVVGGSGYTGGELLRMLIAHPQVDDVKSTSRTYKGTPISDVHPNLKGILDSRFLEYDEGKVDADVAFLAVPHGQSMEFAPKLLDSGIKVVDLSADYRISDVAAYERYYEKHKSPELLKEAVYGLPELYRSDIRKARLVANPGCYPTATILGIAPLEKYKDTIRLDIVVDAKSGTSGAGTKPSQFLHHSEVDGGLKPYKVTGHRHQPEMETVLRRHIPGISIAFTPTLVPTTRGILATIHVFGDLEVVDLPKEYSQRYRDEPFVRVVDTAYTKNVLHSNYCDISVHCDSEKKRTVIISAIDNLVKGAAGQAVQNMNLMMDYAEEEGLSQPPYHP